MVANGCPFCAAYYSDVFNGENCEEQILVGSVIPVLVHLGLGLGLGLGSSVTLLTRLQDLIELLLLKGMIVSYLLSLKIGSGTNVKRKWNSKGAPGRKSNKLVV